MYHKNRLKESSKLQYLKRGPRAPAIHQNDACFVRSKMDVLQVDSCYLKSMSMLPSK